MIRSTGMANASYVANPILMGEQGHHQNRGGWLGGGMAAA
jgi:hypothetical protein